MRNDIKFLYKAALFCTVAVVGSNCGGCDNKTAPKANIRQQTNLPEQKQKMMDAVFKALSKDKEREKALTPVQDAMHSQGVSNNRPLESNQQIRSFTHVPQSKTDQKINTSTEVNSIEYIGQNDALIKESMADIKREIMKSGASESDINMFMSRLKKMINQYRGHLNKKDNIEAIQTKIGILAVETMLEMGIEHEKIEAEKKMKKRVKEGLVRNAKFQDGSKLDPSKERDMEFKKAAEECVLKATIESCRKIEKKTKKLFFEFKNRAFRENYREEELEGKFKEEFGEKFFIKLYKEVYEELSRSLIDSLNKQGFKDYVDRLNWPA